MLFFGLALGKFLGFILFIGCLLLELYCCCYFCSFSFLGNFGNWEILGIGKTFEFNRNYTLLTIILIPNVGNFRRVEVESQFNIKRSVNLIDQLVAKPVVALVR